MLHTQPIIQSKLPAVTSLALTDKFVTFVFTVMLLHTQIVQSKLPAVTSSALTSLSVLSSLYVAHIHRQVQSKLPAVTEIVSSDKFVSSVCLHYYAAAHRSLVQSVSDIVTTLTSDFVFNGLHHIVLHTHIIQSKPLPTAVTSSALAAKKYRSAYSFFSRTTSTCLSISHTLKSVSRHFIH